MEEPEDGGPHQMRFEAEESNVTPVKANRLEQKKTQAARLRARKATPRPVMKGIGKKRFNLSPSPKGKQTNKKADASVGKAFSKLRNSRNLLLELEAADPPDIKITSPEIEEGVSTSSSVASPLNDDMVGVGTEKSVASPHHTSPKGVGTEPEVASPHSSTPAGVGCSVSSTDKVTQDVVNYKQIEELGMEKAEAGGVNAVSTVSTNSLLSPEPTAGILEKAGTTIFDLTVTGPEVQPSMVQEKDGLDGNSGDDGKSMGGVLSNGVLHADVGKESNFLLKNENQLSYQSINKVVQGSNSHGSVDNINSFFSPVRDDMLMDICAAQPLRTQPLLYLQTTAIVNGEGNTWSNKVKDMEPLVRDISSSRPLSIEAKGVNTPLGLHESEFPPLQGGRIKDIMKNYEGGTKSNSHPDSKVEQGSFVSCHQKEDTVGNAMPEISLAERLKKAEAIPLGREPVNFNKDKLKKIGSVTISEGRPALVFSCEDTKYLADQMGHTIVGKFSHSIPSSTQIQKVLASFKFKGGFSWRYINAKHIAIRVEEPDDYAMLLIGSNGMPVWFVDHHPMRVFKWTTDFDPFFETPIAAVWCNIIGLPIHLFDKSALYAIGRLLGTPIQLDHATANQSRLSFARLCIEIDISKATNEEIVLDICGKETVYKVVWDKIPPYCRECQHVGHVSAKCKAFGRHDQRDLNNNRQDTRVGGYKSYYHKHQGARGSNGEARKDQTEGVKETQNNRPPSEAYRRNNHNQNLKWRERNHQNKESGRLSEVDEEGFLKKGKRRDQKNNQGGLFRTNSTGNMTKGKESVKSSETIQTEKAEGESGILAQHRKEGMGRKQEERIMQFAKPSYYQQLENGEFTTGDTDSEEDMEEDPNPILHLQQEQNLKDSIQGGEPEQQMLLEYNKERDRGEASPSYSIRI